MKKAENAGLDLQKEIAGLDLDSLKLIANPDWSNIWQQDVLDSCNNLLNSTVVVSKTLEGVLSEIGVGQEIKTNLRSLDNWRNFARFYFGS